MTSFDLCRVYQESCRSPARGNARTPDEIARNEMSAVYIALPVALLLALVGVLAFIWSVRTGQLDDLTTPGVRVLVDDDEPAADHSEAGHDQLPNEPERGSETETRA